MLGRTTLVSLCLVSVGGCLQGLGHWGQVLVTDRLKPSAAAEAAVMVGGNLTRAECRLLLSEILLWRQKTKRANFSPVDRISWNWEMVTKYGLP